MVEQAEEPIADVLCVEEAHGEVYFLVINYYRNDPAHAAGYLFERAAGTDEAARNILATNDTLRTLWCSPSGSLWLTSTTGLVWTTANVPWPQDVTEPDLEFDTPEGNLVWRHGALPRQAHDDLAPNATSIWGFDDGDVYVGSFGGVVYHWDGKSWSQYFSGLAGSIGAVRGRARNDVYAVGYNSTILHFDGSSWKIVADPDGEGTNDILTGVAPTDSGDVFISGKSRGGRLLRGSSGGFSVVGRYGVPLIGVVHQEGRLIFAATTSGVVELTAAGLVTLRDDLIPWSVSQGKGRLYFTETPGKPAYSEFNLSTGTWRRLSY